MKINKVEIKNFYSIKSSVLNFDKFKGLVLVKGKNKDTGGSNGAGKSAFIEGVVWGLFGRTIRKSTEEALVNVYTKKRCSVRLTVNDNVVIERGKKPTYLKFFVNDEEKTLDNALNTQKLIEKYLNTNYKVFLASTVFGQQNNIEFISATPEDKRTIIKNFLNMDSLFSLRDSVKYLKSEYSQVIKKKSAVVEEHEKTVEELDEKIAKVDLLKGEYEDSKYSEALKFSLEEILDMEEINTGVEWQVDGLRKENAAAEEKIEVLRARLVDPEMSEVCDKCGQTITIPFHPRRIGNDILECEKVVSTNERIIELKLNSIKEPPVPSREYSKILEYKSLCDQVETFEELREETKNKIQDTHNVKQEYNNKYEIMKFWEKAFSESGLVKYVIRNVLDYFNAKTNFYLSHLSKGKFSIEFDEELRESIFHNDNQISYISLSGGEKKKVGLAVMLGLQQLLTLSHKEENNLMFFDEVAENLDQDGLDGLYILLSELKKNKKLFVITHNNYLKSLMDNVKTLTITKHKGISSITGR